MTKLTKEQIEQERVKFESIFKKPSDCEFIGTRYVATEYNAWDANDYAKKFQGWLARAELDKGE